MAVRFKMIRNVLANQQLRSARKDMDPGLLSLPSDLLRPRRILVCLPPGLRELTIIKQYLPTLTSMFKNADISLLTLPGVKVHDMYPRKGFQILCPTGDQATWAGTAKRSYLNMLTDQKFDMILDLNLTRSHFTSSVLLSFPKAVRIGCGNHLGDPYYNLEIKTKYLRDERNIYRSLLETLGTLINRPVAMPGSRN